MTEKWLVLCLAGIFSLFAFPAYAYLDPGTGSMIIQLVIGGIAAGGVALKVYWHKLRLFFGWDVANDDDMNNDPSS